MKCQDPLCDFEDCDMGLPSDTLDRLQTEHDELIDLLIRWRNAPAGCGPLGETDVWLDSHGYEFE